MNEYCITFLDEQNEELFHCHVIAPNDTLATTLALHDALTNGAPLAKFRCIALKCLLDIPATAAEELAKQVAALGIGPKEEAPKPPAGAHLH